MPYCLYPHVKVESYIKIWKRIVTRKYHYKSDQISISLPHICILQRCCKIPPPPKKKSHFNKKLKINVSKTGKQVVSQYK